MSLKLPFISVVVPAYNEEGFLPRCLGSLKQQDYTGGYEIIVVDNGSSDRTAEVASDFGVRVVFEGRRSPAWARQRGLLEANGEIVAFIDADSIAPRNWLNTIARRFALAPRIVSVTGAHAYFDTRLPIRVISYVVNFLVIILDHFFRRISRKGGALWGSNFAVRRQTLLEVGGFDTTKKFRGEDYELSLRLKEKGKLSLSPSLFVKTSSRCLKREGIWSAYWNYLINYFSMLLCRQPAPERLEDLPRKLGEPIWNKLYLLLSSSRLSFDRIITHGDRSHRQIALTFDDGPNEPFTSHILDILKQHDIKATFFMVGQNVRRSIEVCRRLLKEGHIIGNHSYFHSRWLAFKGSKEIKRELELTQEVIYQVSGARPNLFRPPYGIQSPWLLRAAKDLGLIVVIWDNMTNDWHFGKKAGQIAEAILKKVKAGGIIVLHDGRDTQQGYDRVSLLEALPLILTGLKQSGYRCVTIPELLAFG